MSADSLRTRHRMGVDIGGTFTDVAISVRDGYVSAKLPTTPDDPVQGVREAMRTALARAALEPGDVGTVIHGTTLATNAIIEKKGAVTGVITTEGFRDILEIAYERRYDQYDIYLEKPDLLVPRERCLTVPERIDADGEVWRALDEAAIDSLMDRVERLGIESLAIGLLHSYANPVHEQRLRQLIAERRPDLPISLSCEVCPEIREFDRLCTTVVNAYIEPLMARYLHSLVRALEVDGFDCPLLVMTSGGGMTTVDTAVRFPVRLVESGPSGGALLARRIAKELGLESVVSFDMGGTTAKLCLIDGAQPLTSRHFEVARAARFIRGSGIPLRIPVIEMIEIGAGGGSIASVDELGRIAVGPQSAGADPGPACYALGGARATVTDADSLLGYLDPDAFAEGRLRLDPEKANAAIEQDVGRPLALPAPEAAQAISRMVDENMANAARIHAVEHGREISGRTLVAFGGNGPLHATRVAARTGTERIVVPRDPGVGSALGFLSAPVSYEIVRSRYTTLDAFDFDAVNRLFEAMERESMAVVQAGAPDAGIDVARTAFMRYRGQGHEIEVPVPLGRLGAAAAEHLRAAYDERYVSLFGRVVPRMVVEIMNWSVLASAVQAEPEPLPAVRGHGAPRAAGARGLFVDGAAEPLEVPCYRRDDLVPGNHILGPALVVEAQTTTFVSAGFEAVVDAGWNIVLTRVSQARATP